MRARKRTRLAHERLPVTGSSPDGEQGAAGLAPATTKLPVHREAMTPPTHPGGGGGATVARTWQQHFTHRLWTCVASSPNPTGAGDALLRHADDTVH